MTDQQDHPANAQSSAIPPPFLPEKKADVRCPLAAIIIGIILLACAGLNIIQIIYLLSDGYPVTHYSSAYMTSARIGMISLKIFTVVNTLLLIIIGIGLLRMASWARKGAVALLFWFFIFEVTAFGLFVLFWLQFPGMVMREMLIYIMRLALRLMIVLVAIRIMFVVLNRPNVTTAFKAVGER